MEQNVTVDRLAVPIKITGQRLKIVWVFSFCCCFNRMPEMRGPAGERIGETFSAIGASDL